MEKCSAGPFSTPTEFFPYSPLYLFGACHLYKQHFRYSPLLQVVSQLMFSYVTQSFWVSMCSNLHKTLFTFLVGIAVLLSLTCSVIFPLLHQRDIMCSLILVKLRMKLTHNAGQPKRSSADTYLL